MNSRRQVFDTRWAKGGTTALYLRHTYNAKGQVSNIADLAPGGVNRAYSYDALGRLSNASGPWGNGSYSYDALSNLRSRVVGADVVNINYNGLNLVSNITGTAGNRTYIHDARGNVISDGRYGFYNNMSDQPVALNGDATSSYMYDGNKKRVRVWTDDSPSAELIYSVYSASGTLLTRDNATTGVETDYVTAGAGGKTFARRKGGVWSYIHGDHLGSVTTVTNSAGNISYREEYRPFGETQLNPSANDNDTGFTGHIKDADTGLNYMQARYYDPLIGRFLSVDPVGFSVGRPFMFGRYTYVGNDPVNGTDPTGEAELTAEGFGKRIIIRGSSRAVAVVGFGAGVTQIDSPVPGPADLLGGVIITVGLVLGAEIILSDSAPDPVDSILEGATPGRKTKGRSKVFDKLGGVDQANDDFDSLVDPDTVENRGNGIRTGELKDGRKINVRPTSSGDAPRPTVEIQKGKNKTKIRYNDE